MWLALSRWTIVLTVARWLRIDSKAD